MPVLKISTNQFAAFERAAGRNFEDTMVTHLAEFAPGHAAALGNPALRQLVKTGIARAKRVGFDMRGPARFYIELMVTFGSDFDTDPLLPWTHYLRARVEPDPLRRARQLHDTVRGYRKTVFGDAYEFEAEALCRLLRTSPDDWLSAPKNEAWERTRAIFPQKCDFAGEDNFTLLLKEAEDKAASLGLPTDSAAGLTALMTALGHGCLHDPQFPWLGRLLQAPGTPEDLVRRIFVFFRAALADLEGRPGDA